LFRNKSERLKNYKNAGLAKQPVDVHTLEHDQQALSEKAPEEGNTQNANGAI
jgi:hypothetical protein